MILRTLLLLGLGLALLAVPRPTMARAADGPIVQAAALRLGHQPTARVVRWLRHQPSVQGAWIEPDRSTVGIRFRDGAIMAILGRLQPLPKTAIRQFQVRRLLRTNAGAGRAAVLLPFASELGVGPNAGDPEISALRSAGFTVDAAYDQQVTPATVQSFPQYNVVYDWTHTGVFSGTGWLATGQTGACPPHFNPDGMTAVLAVAGSSQCYLSVNAQFIATQLGPFPAHALVFVNGCALLTSDQFWQALAGRGVSTMVSWDNDSATYDDFLSAAAFFNQMAGGASVQGALNALYAAGYGRSSYQGQPATLGFRGDGTLTLAASSGGGPVATATPTATSVPPTATSVPPTGTPPPPPATPTGTPIPTQMPTNTPIPSATATNTAVPPSPTLVLAPTVKAGETQTVSLQHVDPGSTVKVTVSFPDGERTTLDGTAAGDGSVQIRFTQPAGKITRHRFTADVAVTGNSPAGPFDLTEHYTIGFGLIDLTVQPWQQQPGRFLTLWVHTIRHAAVTFTVQVPRHKAVTMRAKTGSAGWAGARYRLPRNAHGTVTVHVVARSGRKTLKAVAHSSIG